MRLHYQEKYFSLPNKIKNNIFNVIRNTELPDVAIFKQYGYFHHFQNTLETITDEDFIRHREAHAVNRLERPKKLYHLTTMWWAEITSNQYQFNRDLVEVDYLKTLTKEDVLQYFNKYVSHESLLRKKLSAQVKSTVPREENDKESGADKPKEDTEVPLLNIKEGEVLPCISSFKKSLALYPLMKPYMPITLKSK